MIFIVAGTQDGWALAGRLLQVGYRVITSVVSSYGEKLLAAYPGILELDPNASWAFSVIVVFILPYLSNFDIDSLILFTLTCSAGFCLHKIIRHYFSC